MFVNDLMSADDLRERLNEENEKETIIMQALSRLGETKEDQEKPKGVKNRFFDASVEVVYC